MKRRAACVFGPSADTFHFENASQLQERAPMFVCICKAVTDSQLDSAIEQGAQTVEDLGACTGAGTDCGGCHNALEAQVKRTCARMSGGSCGSARECLGERG
jgi:bacterioferritin-associated ferredoxin